MNAVRTTYTFSISFALALLVFPVLFTGCGDDLSESLTDAPNVDVECSFDKVNACAPQSAGSNMYGGVQSKDQGGCRAQLQMIQNQEEFKNQFLYTSTTKAETNGSVLTGVFTRWVNIHDKEIKIFPKDTLRLCAFIDSNANGMADTGEPFSDTLIKVGESFPPVTNWTAL